MDQENLTLVPISETPARSGQDGAPSGLAFASDATLDRIEFSVPGPIVEQLEKTSRVEGVDVSCMLLSAFALVLHRYTGGLLDEWIRADTQQTFGDLARQLSSDPSYGFDSECLSKLFCVHDFPRDIGTPTIPECRMLFVCDAWDRESRQATADSQNASCSRSQDIELGIDLPLFGARFDLEMILRRKLDSDSGKPIVQGHVYYCVDLWDKSTVSSWVGRLTRLLDLLIDQPQAPLESIELVSGDELSELTQLEGPKAVSCYLEKTIEELFRDQVNASPTSVAVSDTNRDFTYVELQDRAEQIATWLLERGLGVGSRVAVLLNRSFDSIASLFGIWKAGGVYLPLDPSYPRERLKYFLQDAQAQFLLVEPELIGTIEFPQDKTLVLDPSQELVTRETVRRGDFAPVRIDDPAYLLYTSGSTGEPKGVLMPHRAIANLIAWQKTHERLLVPARTLQFAPKCFDVSIQEIASTLTSGGTLVLIDEKQRLDPHALMEFIQVNRVQRVFLPFVMIDAIVRVGKLVDVCHLRDIVSAGESLKLTEPLRDFLRAHPECRLHNHYGPTETHVVTETMVSLADFDEAAEASIGRPIPNCGCLILDQNARRVPRGAIGELYLSGACLSSGYFGKEDLTSERFVALPDLAGNSHHRFYRTGDLARWRYDGKLDFLGRADTQVKLRGFRIELGEIESILIQHPSIAQCVVILREDRPGDKRLVAYYTQCDAQPPSILELRESLGTKLPEYMVPAAYVRLDALPLTPSGKIDRRALPLPDIQDVGVQDQYTPARNGIEEQLVQIWTEVLGIERVGIHDNFFALGGHSLLAVRLFSEINNRLGQKLPLSSLFQQGTVSQISQMIHESTECQPIARIVQLSDSKDGPSIIIMPGLNGELLYSKELVDRIEHRSNVVGLQPNLDTRFLDIYADFGRMAGEYVRVIRSHQPQGPYRVLGYSYGGILGFEIARQLEEQGQAVDFCGVIDTGIEPDLSYRQLGSVAVHLARVTINLPRWIAASCGPGNFRNTMNRANRKLRYFGRSLLARGKTKYTFEDEFGTKRSHDYRRKVLGCIFQSFNDYKPRNYLGRVTLFRAVVRPLFKCLSPDLGWSRIAAHVDVHRVPGDHETILHSAQSDCIGKVIRESAEGLATSDHA